jgi:hypothetical protein
MKLDVCQKCHHTTPFRDERCKESTCPLLSKSSEQPRAPGAIDQRDGFGMCAAPLSSVEPDIKAHQERFERKVEATLAALPSEKPQPSATPHTATWVASVINENPLIQSLLYDIDLLPEQIKESDERRYGYMLAVIGHMKAAQSATAPLATEHRARGLTPEVVATHYPQTQHQPDECEICDCVFKIAAEALATADKTASGKGQG